ncbi:MAG: DUF4384 domain-containing protein [Bryobacteraceae bacterium]
MRRYLVPFLPTPQVGQALSPANRRGLLAAAVALGAALVLQAQDTGGEIRTRQLWDMSLRQQRPQKTNKPSTLPHSATDDAFVGITLWRLRPSKSDDAPSVRMLVHEPETGKNEDWTPERCEAKTPLHAGQRVRISIESARSGYLYVVDREQYADGSFGDAKLIFPTLKTRRGNNKVQAGQVVDIPGTGEGTLKVELSRPDQVAEELTILVSPKRIEGLSIGSEALPIPKEQLAEWKKNWGAPNKELEESGQVGKAYTPAEKDAAETGAALTDADPLPQTMFQVKSGPGNPLLVTVPLRIEKR